MNTPTINELLYAARDIRIELATKVEDSKIHSVGEQALLLEAYQNASALVQTLIVLDLKS